MHPLGFKPSPTIAASNFAQPASASKSFHAAASPASVDLTAYAPPPGDQGQISSCVSWSVAYDLMGYYANRTGHVGAPFAPMYIYSQVNGGSDQGSTFFDNFQLLAAQGVDTKADYRPQGDYDWSKKPTNAQRISASFHRGLSPTMLFGGLGQGTNPRPAISNALAAGQPVVIGIGVFEKFYYLNASKSTFTKADISGSFLGYHAVTAFGYNATGLIIENSWGAGWGKGGFATLGWDFVANNVVEAWTTAGFASSPVTVAVAPTAWSSAGVGTPATMTAQTSVFGSSASGFNSLGWRLTVGGTVVPVTWQSPTQISFTAPAGNVGPATIALTRSGAPAIVSTPVTYVPAISNLTVVQRPDGNRMLTISGAGLSSGSRWSLVAPSGATSALTVAAFNDVASGALNRIWTSPDGRYAVALVGSVDPVLRETGAYGLSYVGPDSGAILAWPNGGVPFLAPTISHLSISRLVNSVTSDVTLSGDGLAALMSPYPSGVRLVSDATGQSIGLVVKAKTVSSAAVTIPSGTAIGAYHLVVWTPLGTSNVNAASALVIVGNGVR